jgi:hypothetical protein
MSTTNNGSSAGLGQPIQITTSSDIGWLKENQITSISQPFIRAIFNPYDTDDSKIQIANKTIITSAEIEGKTKISRKGKIEIIDPEGLWPERLTTVGFISNHFTGTRLPNIKVEFGWTNVFNSNGRTTQAIESLDGLITKVEFDVTAEGITKAIIYFIETVTEILSTIRILDPNDIKTFYDDKMLFDASPVYFKLKYLFNTDKFSFAKQLRDNGIILEFEKTADDENVKIELDWGDFIIDKINELTAKARRPGDKDKKESEHTDAVYERTGAPIYTGSNISIKDNRIPESKIIYGWVETPDENSTAEQRRKIWEDTTQGPTLFWKKAFNPSEGKKMIEWSSDLSSHGHLIDQAQDELTKKLTEFAEEDWKYLSERIRKDGKDYADISRGFLESKNSFNEKVETVEQFKEIEQSIAGAATDSANNQLRAILMQNVFKGTTKILGDPFFGTSENGEAYKMRFKVDFGLPVDGSNDSGTFTSLFTREWLLTNIKHIFSEGSYVTELQLLAYPDPGYDRRQKIDNIINNWEKTNGYPMPDYVMDQIRSSVP